jgi:DNA (cytosine-5)-methyltransferase 1
MDGIRPPKPQSPLRVCELFAGVGGFHVALARAGMRVVWANQWEPGTRTQHAFECYDRHFPGICVNEDIEKVIRGHQQGRPVGRPIPPEHDLLVGGFPCQDYSVAKPLSQADGIEGRKGVLWWQIQAWLYQFRPGYLFLENVDRLLKSPSTQRGRDFAVMLTCLAKLGYEIEWRVINAADFGFFQKRRRVFLVGRHSSLVRSQVANPIEWILHDGVLAEACPVRARREAAQLRLSELEQRFWLDREGRTDPFEVTRNFGKRSSRSPFLNAGYMRDGQVWALDVVADYSGPKARLKRLLQSDHEVPPEFWVKGAALAKWKYLKGPKAEKRIHPKSGYEYFYTEGGIPFPDRIDGPARTILTGEGGATPSRFKHIVDPKGDGRFRRLTPIELERLNGFDDSWTAGMPAGRRAFCMGNALVVGLVERIGRVLAARAAASGGRAPMRRPRTLRKAG